MIVLGWLIMCAIAIFFWAAAGGFLTVAAVFKASELLVMALIMTLLALGFSYGVFENYPFNPITLKVKL